MSTGMRMPKWKERENNMRRERRRRAIAAKIYAGLRTHGKYKLPKHCDNNEVLKALCKEAGWTVEEDGTTYRKGCKPVTRMDTVGGSTSASPCSSYQPSPCASYNPSPASSSFPSPVASRYISNGNGDANSLIPWFKNLSSSSSSSVTSKLPFHLYMHAGSASAPVTPPLSSPTCRTPRTQNDWDDTTAGPAWSGQNYSILPSSTPHSPGRQVLPDSGWLAGLRISQSGSSLLATANIQQSSPTFSLVSRSPFGFKDEPLSGACSRMWSPMQSGTCSPAVAAGVENTADVPMSDEIVAEFAFGGNTTGLVKPWEGERIHKECISDDLELTLGNSKPGREVCWKK